MEHIGVFTSGGDSPGMNAAIRAVTRTAIHYGMQVSGIRRGYDGMLKGDIIPLKRRSVANILHCGGTFLKTARCEEFRSAEGRTKAAQQLKDHGITSLVCIGGNGSYMGAHLLQEEHGIRCIGLPGTIDNDLYGTDYTIGYDTAINTALEAIDRIRDTADSHNRVFLVEVMGRDSGFIAMHTGIAGGAEAILIPEDKHDMELMIKHFENDERRTKAFSIVVVAEGDEEGGAIKISGELKKKFPDMNVRATVLGHIQRGGNPSAGDRILASVLGYNAVLALKEGESSVAIGQMGGKIVKIPLLKAATHSKSVSPEMIEMAKILST